MTIAYADLNPILSRWLVKPSTEAAKLDCEGCARALKCCDFQPFVANFLLGAVLASGGNLPPPSSSFHYTPLGMVPSRVYRSRYASTPESERDLNLRCAFFAHGRCSIWSMRPGECSAYLCTPPTLGRTALSKQSFELESALSQMALVFQGFSRGEIARQVDFLNQPEADGTDPRSDIFELYRRTWSWAEPLSAQEVAGFFEESL